jgi:hypothetical protein
MLITSDRQREKERATTIHNIYNTVHKEKTKMEEKFKVVFVCPTIFLILFFNIFLIKN